MECGMERSIETITRSVERSCRFLNEDVSPGNRRHRKRSEVIKRSPRRSKRRAPSSTSAKGSCRECPSWSRGRRKANGARRRGLLRREVLAALVRKPLRPACSLMRCLVDSIPGPRRVLCQAIRSALLQGGLVGWPGLKALHPSLDVRVVVDSETRAGELANETQLDVGGRELVAQNVWALLQRTV